ncbi:hypothetical protein BFK25_004543 [Salmonella enterica subsp. enterica serovar Braenderup]|nr:hypothetical protein [Salmonella enterica]EBI0050965.1 hypothetical protein [Salmonella enterica subsp. enterica serovar Braenderup]EDB5183698.1 hypothetical protein [Salmonella enterica subsp. enterica serovar Dublin]EDB5196995.1 hypothetical protein [Salmonella enterica subsp. enterica serovar Heidelberg]EDD5408125.1 hypothetical protein [Salmonella enterica subsp. enterica serovar Newport]EDJ7025607.1 hypothetical protein [Salmonella enterica subsp. enterica serovar Typhimurium]EDM57055
MIVRLDNRLFEILDEMGARVDREMFMAAYAQRKAEKENDPRHVRQRKMTQLTHDLMSATDPEL